MRAFVIAMENEAEAVRPALRGDDLLIVSGIGKVNAAAATVSAIRAGATEIVNAGLCGGFDPSMEVGDVYEVESAVEYDFDLAELNGTDVGVLNERTSAYIPMTATGKFPAKILATGDHFRNGDADLALLGRLGCTLRDMEGAAIAHVCEREGIPCRALKCVSNVQGRGAMLGQYAANAERALTALAAACRAAL